jgi:hypothetical protein
MEYQSETRIESTAMPGVWLTIGKMSFERRIELTRRIWELAGRVEHLDGSSEARDKLEAAVVAGEIDRIYLSWGLRKIEGLEIDGEPATPETAAARGPEELCREAVAAIKAECGLSADETKN